MHVYACLQVPAPYGGLLASVLNAVQISILNAVFSSIAIKLNGWEHHVRSISYILCLWGSRCRTRSSRRRWCRGAGN
jgi:hypothetical protein